MYSDAQFIDDCIHLSVKQPCKLSSRLDTYVSTHSLKVEYAGNIHILLLF